MEYFILPLTALTASLLTFFSGFGLGTILTPTFLLFFPVDIAIGMTAVVHFCNNLFKIILVKRYINYQALIKFGIAGMLGAYIGATALLSLEHLDFQLSWNLFSQEIITSPIRVTIGIIMILFALSEFISTKNKFEIKNWFIYLGGILSGFFGGLSGHQGALRSIFLIKFNLDKNAFIATGIAIACLIDITRLSIYTQNLNKIKLTANFNLIIITCLAAFVGALAGKKLLTKVTISFIQKIVGIAIMLLGTGLIFGIF